jgi:hypothetical protein
MCCAASDDYVAIVDVATTVPEGPKVCGLTSARTMTRSIFAYGDKSSAYTRRLHGMGPRQLY